MIGRTEPDPSRSSAASANASIRSGVAWAASGLLLVIVAYLTHATIQGEHGISRLVEVGSHEATMTEELDQLRRERAELGALVDGMSVPVDVELLDQQAREALSLIGVHELIGPP